MNSHENRREDHYYIRHEIGGKRLDFPWHAFRGDDYPMGYFLGVAMTRWGVVRIIRRDRKRRALPNLGIETIEL